MKQLRLLIVFLFVSSAALAAKKVPSTYSPEFCEFSVTFPSEPYKTRRCDDNKADRCYDLVSYTQVYEMTATVNFRVICNPVNAEVKKNYSGEIMQATLKAMTKDKVVKNFETSFREEEQFKQAGLVGEGKVGRTPTIYLAQMWIGDKSAFTVEAELIGEANEEADKLFSEVLKSVYFVTEEEKKAAEKKESEDSEKDDPDESGNKEDKKDD